MLGCSTVINSSVGAIANDRFFRRSFSLRGRASRAEFWWPVATSAVVFAVASLVLWLATEETLLRTMGGVVVSALAAGHFIPVVTLSVRRMHDFGFSGLWLLLAIPVLLLYPMIGLVVLVGLFCLPGNHLANKFGTAPDLLNTPTSA
ncbi:DUF805 domain-containing protein [Loktanella salsilacus]|jgi:uncharacterized membrane protein YhaH (DUF805 family)|uniref:DUF805 domain-containing protein n=1 Tax=Loktanella salsilacus TaxID=195913 RepID=UPI003AB970A0